jgi:hypothetical protein
MKRLILAVGILLGSCALFAQTLELELKASSKVIVDGGYDYTELSVTPWGGSHGIFFGSKVNYTRANHLWGSNNTVYAHPSGQYSYGTFFMGYIANGGVFSFYDGGLSNGAGNPVTWSPVMTMVRGGNVGIGTTNPTEKLHVTGTIRSANLLLNSGEAVYFGNTNIYISGNTLGNLTLVGSGNIRMWVTDAGNIGIGTTNPGLYKLAVNGPAIFTKAVV